MTSSNFVWPEDKANFLVQAGKVRLEQRRKPLEELLTKSEEILSPLGEPLKLNFLHRQLKKENDYSDWLEWLIKNMRVSEITDLFDIEYDAKNELEKNEKIPLGVFREFYVKKGNEEQSGRLDLLIELTNDAILVLELKRGEIAGADTKKQNGYFESMESSGKQCRYILLVTDLEHVKKIEKFTVMSYWALCSKLREWSAKAIREKDSRCLTLFAMALAFVGAIEVNLLGITISGLPSEKVLKHLKTFLGK